MNQGHIYFEIQADDPKRAIDFYVQTFGWKFSEVPGLTHSILDDRNGRFERGLAAAASQDAPAPMWDERFCKLARGRRF
jgi:predicted enzyme related to lactoylglutathione lyase